MQYNADPSVKHVSKFYRSGQIHLSCYIDRNSHYHGPFRCFRRDGSVMYDLNFDHGLFHMKQQLFGLAPIGLYREATFNLGVACCDREIADGRTVIQSGLNNGAYIIWIDTLGVRPWLEDERKELAQQWAIEYLWAEEEISAIEEEARKNPFQAVPISKVEEEAINRLSIRLGDTPVAMDLREGEEITPAITCC
jgi:hypothetical protein